MLIASVCTHSCMRWVCPFARVSEKQAGMRQLWPQPTLRERTYMQRLPPIIWIHFKCLISLHILMPE